MFSSRFNFLCALLLGISLATLAGFGARRAWAAPQSENKSEDAANHALNAAFVQAYDNALTFVGQDVVETPVPGASREIKYEIKGPGEGAKSYVEYRIYDSAEDAAAHADPDLAQQKSEATADDMPHGSFKAYHSSLSGSALAAEVPETFHCVALTGGNPWSRCYYYPGTHSDVVVVGTTTSTAPNEAILITAMGAQGFVEKR
jgi:hypothetical protein